MAVTVRLNDIVDALATLSEEFSSFLDLDTGQVETIDDEVLSKAEESEEDEAPDLPEWQKESWETAKRIVSTDRFQELPTKFDVHEWNIMQEFSSSVKSARIREELLDAVHGAGAFGNFKTIVGRHRLESAWSQFRAGALRQIAVDWFEEHHITWE